MEKYVNYTDWSRKNWDKSNKYWALYAGIYDNVIKKIKTPTELEKTIDVLLNKAKNAEQRDIYNMFYLYHKDKLAGKKVGNIYENILESLKIKLMELSKSTIKKSTLKDLIREEVAQILNTHKISTP